MSIITDLKSKVTGAPAPADLKFMLSQAQDVLDHLQDDYGAAALSAISDPTAGQKALDQIKTQIAGQKDRIADIKAALVIAEKQAQDLMQAQRKSLQKSQFLAASKHLDLVNGAAADYAKAIAEAAASYRKMQEHSEKARSACPLLTEYPRFAFNEIELVRLAGGEAYRHTTGALGGDAHALPGAVASEADFIGDPGRMPPIEETVRATNEDVKLALKKQLIT